MLKKLITLVAFIALGGYLFTSYSTCDQPIHYKIGKVDEQFNLTEEKFAETIDQAGKIWSKAYGKPLFIYDPQGPLSISMVYDGRQTLTTKITQIEKNLNSEKKDLAPKIKAYEAQSADYKKKITDLNNQIESWNAKGGAPPEVYQQLLNQQKQLKQEADSLSAQAKALDISTDQYNAQVSKLDTTVDAFNQSLQLKPEEGLYNPQANTIEVYFYINQNELLHTVAHEMGHAIGLEHNQNKQSILYPQTTTALTPSKDDLADLQEVCRPRTHAEILKTHLMQIYDFYKAAHT